MNTLYIYEVLAELDDGFFAFFVKEDTIDDYLPLARSMVRITSGEMDLSLSNGTIERMLILEIILDHVK